MVGVYFTCIWFPLNACTDSSNRNNNLENSSAVKKTYKQTNDLKEVSIIRLRNIWVCPGSCMASAFVQGPALSRAPPWSLMLYSRYFLFFPLELSFASEVDGTLDSDDRVSRPG